LGCQLGIGQRFAVAVLLMLRGQVTFDAPSAGERFLADRTGEFIVAWFHVGLAAAGRRVVEVC